MKIFIIGHTYIAPINREKWKTLAAQHPHAQLTILMPSQWPTHLFNHKAKILSEENTQNCSFISLDVIRAGNEMTYRYRWLPFIKLLKQLQPDIIHVEQGDNALSYFQAILCAKLLRLKSKFCFFTWINWTPQQSWKYTLMWKPIELVNIKLSAGAITGNNEAKQLLLAKQPTLSTMVLPQLGIDPQTFIPAEQRQGIKTIGYIGRLVPEKGLLDLLEAFRAINTRYPDWQLSIVGAGPLKDILTSFINDNSLQNHVNFSDPVAHHEVANILKTIAILVLPSYDTQDWKEQFGHVLIEAMACSIPVIGSTGGEIPNVLQGAGLVFEQRNVEQLVTQLEQLITNQALQQQVGERGYVKVQQHYTHIVIAKKTYEFWQRLLAY